MKVVWKLVFLSNVSKKKRLLRKQWVSASKRHGWKFQAFQKFLSFRDRNSPHGIFVSRGMILQLLYSTYSRHFSFQFTMKSIPKFRRRSFTLIRSVFRLGLTNWRSISGIFTHIYQPLSQINWKKIDNFWIFQALGFFKHGFWMHILMFHSKKVFYSFVLRM